MGHLEMIVNTAKTYRAAIGAVVAATERNGFSVIAVHDIAATLAENGFEREPVSIIEICHARYADAVLAQDVMIGLMLPCPIMVFEQRGGVCIATMRPTLLSRMFPRADIAGVTLEVERIVADIIREAAG